jgi:adenylate cyclase
MWLGETDTAIYHLARTMRPSAFDPHTIAMHAGTAFSHFLAGRCEEARLWVQKALWERTNYLTTLRPPAMRLADDLRKHKKLPLA